MKVIGMNKPDESGTEMIPARTCGPSDSILVEVAPYKYKVGKVKLNWGDNSVEWTAEAENGRGGIETHKLQNCSFTVDSIGK